MLRNTWVMATVPRRHCLRQRRIPAALAHSSSPGRRRVLHPCLKACCPRDPAMWLHFPRSQNAGLVSSARTLPSATGLGWKTNFASPLCMQDTRPAKLQALASSGSRGARAGSAADAVTRQITVRECQGSQAACLSHLLTRRQEEANQMLKSLDLDACHSLSFAYRRILGWRRAYQEQQSPDWNVRLELSLVARCLLSARFAGAASRKRSSSCHFCRT
jgi:hypothetical protein